MSEKTDRQKKADTNPLICAVDVCRGRIIAALVDERARILATREKEIPEAGGKATAQAISEIILEICAVAERGEAEIQAIGLCLPGQIEQRDGRVTSAWLGWDRLALRATIERGLEASGVDVRRASSARRARAEKTTTAYPLIAMTSDATGSVLAETWCGTAMGRQHVLFISISRRIEAGIIAEGRLVQGAGGVAGAAGWFALSEGFREEYVTRGCLETEAAAGAIVRRTMEAWSGETKSLLSRIVADHPADLTPEIIIRAARSGDSLALSVITDVCGWLGRGVAELISTFNPEIVLIGGPTGVALRPYLNEVRREARLWAHPLAARQCRILSATLGKNIGLLGAARFAQIKADQIV